MTSTPRILSLLAAGTLALALSGCAATAPAPAATDDMPTATAMSEACTGDEGVTITVDASALGEEASESWCYFASETVAVSDALAAVGVETEGSKQYGDQLVCRVNGLPAADEALPAEDGSDYFETCDTMPPASAYWSLWIKPAGAEWGFAQEGVSTLQAEPGDAVELLFTLNGEPAEPAA